MLSNPLEFIRSCPVAELRLEREVYETYHQDFWNAQPDYQGILTETGYGLWLSRMYQRPVWSEDPFHYVDIELPGCEIDLKFTSARNTYRDLRPTEAQRNHVLWTGRPIHYALVTPEIWDPRRSIVTFRLHHVVSLARKNYQVSWDWSSELKGATKKFRKTYV